MIQFLLTELLELSPNPFISSLSLWLMKEFLPISFLYYTFFVLQKAKICIKIFSEIKFLLGTDWNPSSIVVDFEKGLINAIRSSFKSVIIGCWFHLKQALYRKIVKLGLKKDNSQWWLVLKSISALALEPIEFIENILEKLEVSFGDNWVKFFAYFKNTWLKVYTPKLWNINYLSNHMNNEFITRTNNYLERYNRKLNENLATHGNIVPMLEFFKKEHMFYRSLIASARDGDSEKYPIEIPVTEDPILTEL